MKNTEKINNFITYIDCNGIKYRIDMDKVVHIDLTTELQQEYDKLSTMKEKQIFVFEYLSKQLNNNEVILKDGKKFINRKKDTHHLIEQHDDLKYKSFLQLNDILNNANYFFEDFKPNHCRFDYFRYYKVSIEINNQILVGLLNIGKIKRSKNDYRFYDLHLLKNIKKNL